MVLSPLQNTGKFTTLWIQKRPYVTQDFGSRPQVYGGFGLKGHNGLDFRCKSGTPLFSPISGKIKVGNSPGGYGRYVYIRGGDKEVVLAHLSRILVNDGEYVHMGQKIALSGNTGFSSGPHLHMGLRYLERGMEDIFGWEVKGYDNGYHGWINLLPFVVTWKGGLNQNNF